MKKSGKIGNYTIVIGIAGADNHVGVTHLSIMLANYLASKEKCRVAVADMSAGNAIAVLKDIYQDCSFREKKNSLTKGRVSFRMHKVDYYSQMKQEDIADIFQMGYEYIVIDFGKVCLHNCNSEILRCHMRILVGSCCEWQQKAFIKVMDDKKIFHDTGKWKYAAFLGIEDIRRRMEKKYHIQIHKIPFEEDPFQLHRNHFEPLRNMLQEETGCL